MKRVTINLSAADAALLAARAARSKRSAAAEGGVIVSAALKHLKP